MSDLRSLSSLTIPDLWQQQAVRALREGKDAVVHAPTGAGKTLIFELLQSTLKGQCVFTVPTRALANDKRAEWLKRGWDVGIATGDRSEGLDRKILVATLETQRMRLLSGRGPRLLVIDEYQMIADPVRGIHYEQTIAMAPPGTQLLLLSGSVGNPQDVVAWLQRIGRNAELISHTQRPVPLEEVDLQALPDRAPASIRGWWPRVIANALREDLGPILLFAPRRQAAEHLALQLAAALPPCSPVSLSPAQQQLAGNPLSRFLKSRVAFHHSGLSYAQRAELIEPLAKAGQLRVVVATMGLSAGINFSMRSVAIAGTVYRVGPFERTVSPPELLQMFGRAGRRGLDTTGYALVTPQPPRLADAHPLQLRRSSQLDWPTLLAVMHQASLQKTSPFFAATRINQRLFSPLPVPLGCEHSLATGPMPCSLQVDSERARFLRRGAQEMWSTQNRWELRPASPVDSTLQEVWAWSPPRNPSAPSIESPSPAVPRGSWRPVESSGTTLAPFLQSSQAKGSLCRLEGPEKRLGLEILLGKRHQGRLQLAPWLLRALGNSQPASIPLEAIAKLLEKLPQIAAGGIPASLKPKGEQLFAYLSYGSKRVEAWKDSADRKLLSPPTRRILPPPCQNCSQQNWCENTPITTLPAQAWRTLGLIEPDGTPTRRGVLFSFFQHGEGLAIAAALEDPDYPIDELLFDLANLRGGPRFTEEEAFDLGRLAACCQKAFRSADFEGYLRFGLPTEYAAGASEAVRNVVLHGLGKRQLLTVTLRLGDIERALLEWKSLLRHISHSPDYPWERWQALQKAATQQLASD